MGSLPLVDPDEPTSVAVLGGTSARWVTTGFMWDKDPRRRSYLRIAAVGLLLVGMVPLVGSYFAASPPTETGPLREDRDAVTVVTIDGTGPSQIVAYGPEGTVLYENHTLDIYHDVDPTPGGDRSVTYVASETDVAETGCNGTDCIRNVVERVNLSTGTVTRLYSRRTRRVGSSQIHDVDRVNESVLLVGDIGPPDRVYMVNTTTGTTIWEWRVNATYPANAGGRHPADWTHLNDVEYLGDGRVMVSLRNMDQVVFVDPGRGIQPNWTLGTDDDHAILYEQHNPDYIPQERGGPAILVADSENNRLVEYQRVNGSWQRSWTWRDARLQWPRDADRLPNGNTLVVDSHGSRLLEVTPTGKVVWQTEFPDGGYDVERLGTGDESSGGESATALGYSNRYATGGGSMFDRVTLYVTSLVPNLVLHGALYVLPAWVNPAGAVAVLFEVTIVACWIVLETGLVLLAKKDRI